MVSITVRADASAIDPLTVYSLVQTFTAAEMNVPNVLLTLLERPIPEDPTDTDGLAVHNTMFDTMRETAGDDRFILHVMIEDLISTIPNGPDRSFANVVGALTTKPANISHYICCSVLPTPCALVPPVARLSGRDGARFRRLTPLNFR